MNDNELQQEPSLTEEDVFSIIKKVPIPLRGIDGLIPTVSAVPSHTPTKFIDQFRIYYLSSASAYFYMYNVSSKDWRSTTFS